MKLLLILIAVIPAVILLVQVYRADRVEKEPISMLLGLLLCGLIAGELSALAEQAGSFFLKRLVPEGTERYSVFLCFGVVALSEEGFKYLLLKLRTWRSREFNCSFDGVVYGVFLSLGFALWENVRYALYFGMGTALARAVTAVPGHACFGVFMGTWYGLAKRWSLRGCEGRSRFGRCLSLLMPLLLHGAYDYIVASHLDDLGWLFLCFILALYLISAGLVRRMSLRDVHMQRQEENETLF
jgi:RsiW-degrading membrane proteinase PrsW (M82 family)